MGPAIAFVTLVSAGLFVTGGAIVASLLVADVPHELIGLHLC
jgi:hypothetical protein